MELEGTKKDILIRQGLKLTHLRLLAALDDTGQISAAAAQIAISQPAASRLLAEIERIIGMKLYQRHPRGVTMNAVGTLLGERARWMLRTLDDAGRDIAEIGSGQRGSVNIGAVTGPAIELVLPVIREARILYPDHDIMIDVDTSDKLAERLLGGSLDFYLGRVLPGLDGSAVKMHLIGDEPVSLIVRKGHPLVGRSNASLQDCLEYDWVMQPPGGLQRYTVDRYLLEHDYRPPNRVVNTNSLMMMLAIVTRTNAIAPVSRAVADFYAGPDGLSGQIETLGVDHKMAVVPYGLVTLRGYELPAASAAIHQMLLKHLNAQKVGAAEF
ncbi:LysR substrate-binding domain-containing protein [Roseinatronobacter sp. NSM]|uniref:LysR substrate-binding domain-containing protein n=1 Tax=Roseinatronobacter sp. NSM TaxID=3457785 RepID=UPI0040373E8B